MQVYCLKKSKFIVAKLLIIGFLVGSIDVIVFLNRVMNVKSPLILEIQPGQSAQAIFKQIPDYPNRYRWYLKMGVKLFNIESKLQAGYYYFDQSIKPYDLIYALLHGQVKTFKYTIVAGTTLAHVLAGLASQAHMAGEADSALALQAELGIAELSLEGLFYPDTYYYHHGSSNVQLLKRAYETMVQKLAELWQIRDVSLPYRNSYEVLIAASILEKEASDPKEQKMIADIIRKRLQKPMRLQMDPTIIYALAEAYQGVLMKAHLKSPSPYNTYLNEGLPPTPICMPSDQALQAIVQPDTTEYWYFVADGTGKHLFAQTLAEHRANIQNIKSQLVDAPLANQASLPLPFSEHDDE